MKKKDIEALFPKMKDFTFEIRGNRVFALDHTGKPCWGGKSKSFTDFWNWSSDRILGPGGGVL